MLRNIIILQGIALSLVTASCNQSSEMITKNIDKVAVDQSSSSKPGSLALSFKVVEDLELALLTTGLSAAQADVITAGALAGIAEAHGTSLTTLGFRSTGGFGLARFPDTNGNGSLNGSQNEKGMDVLIPGMMKGAISSLGSAELAISSEVKLNLLGTMTESTFKSLNGKLDDLSQEVRQAIPGGIAESSLASLSQTGLSSSEISQGIGNVVKAASTNLTNAGFAPQELVAVVTNLTKSSVTGMRSSGVATTDYSSAMSIMVSKVIGGLGDNGVKAEAMQTLMGSVINEAVTGLDRLGMSGAAQMQTVVGTMMESAMKSLKSAGVSTQEQVAPIMTQAIQGAMKGVAKNGIKSSDMGLFTDDLVKGAIGSFSELGIKDAVSVSKLASSAATDTIDYFGILGINDVSSIKSASQGIAVGTMSALGQLRDSGVLSNSDVTSATQNVTSNAAKSMYQHVEKTGIAQDFAAVATGFSNGMVEGLATAGWNAVDIQTISEGIGTGFAAGMSETTIDPTQLVTMTATVRTGTVSFIGDLSKHCTIAKGIWHADGRCEYPTTTPPTSTSSTVAKASAEDETKCNINGGSILYRTDGQWFCDLKGTTDTVTSTSYGCESRGFTWLLGPQGAYCETSTAPSSCWKNLTDLPCDGDTTCSWVGSYCASVSQVSCTDYSLASRCDSNPACNWDLATNLCSSDPCYTNPTATGCTKVAAANQVPVLDAIGDVAATVGAPLASIDAGQAGKDSDADGQALSYTCSFDLTPDNSVSAGTSCGSLAGVAFNESTGVFNWTPTAAASGGVYEFGIVATDGVALAAEYFVVRVAVVDLTPPNPGSLGASGNTDTQITLSWISGGGTSAGYRISYATGATAPASCAVGTQIGSGAISGTSHTVTGLVASTGYSFRVCAINGGVSPLVSSGVTISSNTLALPFPPNPTSPNATVDSDTQITLAWTSGGGTTVDYRISYATGATAPIDCASGTQVGEGAISGTSYVVSTLTASTLYSFRICSINANVLPDVSSGVTASATTNAPANSAPALSSVSDFVVSEDTSKTIAYADMIAAANEYDADGDTISFKLVALSSGTLTTDGSTSVNVGDLLSTSGQWVWLPAANANGSDIQGFTIMAWDGQALSSTAVPVRFDVNAVNDVPTASNNTLGTNEDTPLTIATAAFGFSDIDGDTLASIEITTLESAGALKLAGSDVTLNQVITKASLDVGSLTFEPAANASGAGYATFQFSVNDGSLDGAGSYTMTIDVTAGNDPPTASSNTLSTNEDTQLAIGASAFGYSDNEGSPMASIKITSLETAGALKLSGGDVTLNQVITKSSLDANSLTFDPAVNATGAGYATFQFSVNDGSLDSAGSYTMTIDVTAVNDPPTASSNTLSTNEDTSRTIGASEFGYADAEGSAMASIKITSLETAGALKLSGGDVTLNQVITKASLDSNSLTFEPAANASGAGYATFQFSVNDGSLDSAGSYTMTIDVTAVNDPPTAAANTLSTNEDSQLPIGTGAFGYADIDGDTLASIKITTSVIAGELKLSGAGVTTNQVITKADLDANNLTFVPAINANDSAYATFQFKVYDGTSWSASTYTITIDVTAVDDAPVANNVGASNILKNSSSNSIVLSYSDIEGHSATSCATSSPVQVSVDSCSCSAGTCTASVSGGFNLIGSASFNFTVTANGLTSNQATVSLTINDVPPGTPTITDNGTSIGGANPSFSVSGLTFNGSNIIKLYSGAGCSTFIQQFTVTASTMTVTLTDPLTDGNYTIYARQGDTTPSYSACSSTGASYEVDTAAPDGSFSFSPSQFPTNVATIAVYVVFDEVVVGINVNSFTSDYGTSLSNFSGSGDSYSFDLDVPASLTANVTISTTGSPAITDAAGNVATLNPISVQVDTQAPSSPTTVTFVSTGNPYFGRNAVVQFDDQSSDLTMSHFEIMSCPSPSCSSGCGPVTNALAYQTQGVVTGLPPSGPVYACVKAVDTAGNVSNWTPSSGYLTLGACKPNWVLVPGNSVYGTRDFCVMKYEARNGSGIPVSQSGGTPWISETNYQAKTSCSKLGAGFDLISNDEWMTIASNIASVAGNWNAGTIGTSYLNTGVSSGSSVCNSDSEYATTSCLNASNSFTIKRTHVLNNGENIWDFAGNAEEWVNGFVGQHKPSTGASWQEMTAFGTTYVSNAGWNSSKGIGKIYPGSISITDGLITRGGVFNGSTSTGIFSARLNNTPTNQATSTGFRCVQHLIESNPLRMQIYPLSPISARLLWELMGSDYLVVRGPDTGAPITFVPSNGNSYGTGPYGSDNIVYVGSDETFDDTGLTAGKSYQYRLYMIDGSDDQYRLLDVTQHRTAAASCPSGYVLVSGDSDYGTEDFCMMKYEAKNNGSDVAISVAAGNPWTGLNYYQAKGQCMALGAGYHLVTNPEWMTVAANIANVGVNWDGGIVGTGSLNRGHTDNAPANVLAANADDNVSCGGTGQSCDLSVWNLQRRTHVLSNDQVIWDISGNVWEFVDYYNPVGKAAPIQDAWAEFTSVSDGTNFKKRDILPTAAVKDFWDDSWGSADGTGNYYSGSDITTDGVLRRGGYYNTGSNAGIFAADLDYSYDTTQAGGTGFRCAKYLD